MFATGALSLLSARPARPRNGSVRLSGRPGSAVAYKEWVLDAAGCDPYRKVSEKSHSMSPNAGLEDHHTGAVLYTAEMLRKTSREAHVVIDATLCDKLTAPINISRVSKGLKRSSVVVGNALTNTASGTDDIDGVQIDYDTSAISTEPALACFEVDFFGDLILHDLSGAVMVNGKALGKGQHTKLTPGNSVDLSGQAKGLVFQVLRDEHAHA